ncbi:MAG: ATP-binding protein [Cyclobacteriaceae bacterium]
MILRSLRDNAKNILQNFPVLGLVGSRQVGKTTLAKSLVHHYKKAIYLDLESTSDSEKLANAETFFKQFHDHLIIIDEIQRDRSLFPILRSIIDLDRRPSRFILLGSASPELIRNSSESLAGRIGYLELCPLNILEVDPAKDLDRLWLLGGYPPSFLNPEISSVWLDNYIRTYLERDLPMLGLNANPVTTRRLWTMLAHLNGNTINYSELAKSLDISNQKVKSYIDFLEQSFLIRQLPPYFSNTKKRLVKSPKIYVRDSGILHHLLGVSSELELFGHPKFGSSWEGFVIEQIYQYKKINHQLHFYRTQDGAELDVVITKGGIPAAGIEVKYGASAKISRGNTESAKELSLEKKFVIMKDGEDWQMNNGFIVTSLYGFLTKYIDQI